MTKPKLHTPDFTEANISKLGKLFPSCVVEAKNEKTGELQRSIDFDQLRQELSGHIVEGPHERYRLDWPGKRAALLATNAPIAKTLRPAREESVNFDTTQNLFIEGDNLEALKLLQETYLGKVKMIYIDPPYNTGNDFIYDDDFSETTESYRQRSNQEDDSGRKLVSNPESNGRFHSDWLSFLQPRIRLARNLLTDDGIIIFSIDDCELINLRKMCDEIFGESNFLFQVTLLCNPKGRSQDKYIANCHEFIIGYSKRKIQKGCLNVPRTDEEISKNYRLLDERGRYRELELRNSHREFGKFNRPNLFYPFYVDKNGNVSLDKVENTAEVLPNWNDGFEGCWTWGKEKAKNEIKSLVGRKVSGNWKIYIKDYAISADGKSLKKLKSIWTEKKYHTEKGQAAFNELFNSKEKIFQSPKSVETLKTLLTMGTDTDSVILDFFAGSSTTAHAVMQQNAEDGGKRHFIMVQLPEACDEKSEAFKAGYPTIAEISKERIRRAGQKIKADNSTIAADLDTGFRVLKVDTSNVKDIYYRANQIKQDELDLHVDHIKEDRNAEDLIFQVMLDWGIDLCVPVQAETIAEKTVHFVDKNAIAACFEVGIDEAFVKELAKRRPLRAVFRDSGFADDAMKINVKEIFKQLSPSTELKTV